MLHRSARLVAAAVPLAVLLAVLLGTVGLLAGCPADVGNEGEGEGAAGEGEGAEGEGAEGEGAEGEGAEGEGAGEGEGEGDNCPITPTCPNAATGTLDITATGANEPVVAVNNGGPLTVGVSTRANVEAALGGPGVDVDGLGPFKKAYCDDGVVFNYVDADGTFDTASADGAGTDVIARIITLPGATFTPPTITADGTYTGSGGQVLFDAAKGVEQVEDVDNNVVGVILFKRQPNGDTWGGAMTITPDNEVLAGLDLGNSDFGDAVNVFGDAFDSEGVATVVVAGFDVDVKVRIWASLGVRIAGLCGIGGCDRESITISNITVSPPYFGTDAGIGIGASQADIDNALALAGSDPDANGVTVYDDSANAPLGVVYVQDTSCVERAATFIFGYTPP